MPGQARAVTAGALDAGQSHGPEPAQPVQQAGILGRGGRELPTLGPHHRKTPEAGPNHYPHPPCRLGALGVGSCDVQPRQDMCGAVRSFRSPSGATTRRSAGEEDPGRHHCMNIQREQVNACGLVLRPNGRSWRVSRPWRPPASRFLSGRFW